jgi:DNA-binding beta-propeller fold protein YncE
MSARTYAQSADLPDQDDAACIQVSLSAVPDTKEYDGDTDKHYVRRRIQSVRRYPGVDWATCQFLHGHFNIKNVRLYTQRYNNVSARILTDGVPTEGSNLLHVDRVKQASESIRMRRGWRFVVGTDPTVYEITADSGRETLVSSLTSPNGIALDTTNNYMYWCDATDDAVYRARLDGTGKTTILSGLNNPLGIAVDSANGYLYYANNGGSEVRKCTVAGGGDAQLIAVTDPNDVCLDVANSYVYIACGTDGKIVRCTLTGTGSTDIVTGLSDVIGIDIDLTNSYLYWSNSGATSKLQKATAAGASQADVIAATFPRHLAVDATAGIIYYVETNTDTLRRCTTGGASDTALITTGLDNPYGVALDQSNNKLYVTATNTQTIQRFEGDAASANCEVTVPVTPAITAATAALDDRANVYFFRPTDVRGEKSADAQLYTVSLNEEAITDWVQIDEAEEY